MKAATSLTIEAAFAVGSVQMTYLEDNWRYDSVSSR
jgi:hypothetical protein